MSVLPRPAVSVIPLRDGPAGPEVFVQHRQPTMDFAAGAVVFPGGRCDPGDVAKGAALAVSDAILVDHVHRWRHLPVAQDRQADAVGSEWTAVYSLLDAGESGDLWLMTPTRVILRELLDLGTVAEVVRRRPVITGVRDDRPSARPRASDPV